VAAPHAPEALGARLRDARISLFVRGGEEVGVM
jgi:hypothetical protein